MGHSSQRRHVDGQLVDHAAETGLTALLPLLQLQLY